MINSITFKEHYELSLEKESQKRFKTKTYKPNEYTREKEPWTMFFLFEKGLKIDFKPGVNVIVGENGSGKSTLLRILKDYAGEAPDNLTLSFGDYKDEEDYFQKTRQDVKSPVNLEGELSYRNFVLFDAEDDNPTVAIPKIAHPGRKDFPQLIAHLFFAQEESHGESMIPLLNYILEGVHDCVICMDEPETALSLKNQLMLTRNLYKSAEKNNNQIIISTHSLAVIQEFDDLYDMESRKWVNSKKYIASSYL